MTPAATYGDIPGVLISTGSVLARAVDAADPANVYAIDLVEGQEVHFRCDPGTVGGARGSFHLLVPGASSVADASAYDEIAYTLAAGNPVRSTADFDYIPAKSGRYFLWVQWESGTLAYSLSVARTSRPALALPRDTNDVPGVLIGPGVMSGVVSTLADPDDVYSVRLTAGRPVTIDLLPLTPYANSVPTRASLYLLDGSAQSLADRFGHVVDGRVLSAQNDKNPALQKTAEIEYTPSISGTYFVWVQAGGVLFNPDAGDFAYELSISGNEDVSQPPVFSDVQGSPYEEAIFALAAAGIIRGFPGQTFRPDAPVSRQQFAKMIVKSLGLTVTGSEVCPFLDVAQGLDQGDPFYPDKYVAVCAAHGITQGRSPTTFDPYGDITRQQLITMVVRGAQLPDPPAGYTADFAPGQFFPQDHYLDARRAAYAGLLRNLQGIGPSYDFFASSTRGECAQLLFELIGRR